MNKWLQASVLISVMVSVGCEDKLLKTKGAQEATAILGKCEPDRPISLTEETDAVRGYFNPKDSLYYANVVIGTFYRGGLTNPCELVRRPFEYKNVISRKFRVVWQGPKGVTNDRKIPRALIRFTDKNYRDDVDVSLPEVDTLRPFPFEIKVQDDTGYVNVVTAREYKVALRKGYSNELDQVKCAEVSLSATPTFDASRIILENANAGSWSQRYFFRASDFAPAVQYLVVREKECAVCDVPTPTLTAGKISIAKGEEAVLSFSGCPVTAGSQGPLEWFAQPVGGQKYLVQRYSYSARNERRFSPEITTTYFLRCQGDWYCKPQKEVSVTIEVR
ncbi:MAG: hypothetical protein U0X91_32745 [Spirosomataceae bacterium]